MSVVAQGVYPPSQHIHKETPISSHCSCRGLEVVCCRQRNSPHAAYRPCHLAKSLSGKEGGLGGEGEGGGGHLSIHMLATTPMLVHLSSRQEHDSIPEGMLAMLLCSLTKCINVAH